MTAPILLPIATEVYHIDPRHFGVVIVVNLVLGLMTPPVGLSFFVASAVTGAKPGKMFIVTLPFFIISCVALVMLSLFPACRSACSSSGACRSTDPSPSQRSFTRSSP